MIKASWRWIITALFGTPGKCRKCNKAVAGDVAECDPCWADSMW
jgi:hypothetical protein